MNWKTLAGAQGSPVNLTGRSIISVAARGGTILAAADLPIDNLQPGGLFRSTDGGSTFADVTPGGPLAPGRGVTSLVSDPTRTNSFYAAVSGNGIFVSNDTGNSWNKINTFPPIAANQTAKLAAGPGGSVVAAVYEINGSNTSPTGAGKLVEVYLSRDNGVSWKAIGGDAARNATTYAHLAVAIDKNNPNIVYLAGDVRKNAPDKVIALGAFRLTVNPDGSTTMATLTQEGTADGSTVHADARQFAFDAAGRLLLGTDGGIYTRTSPTTSGGIWMGLNTSTLQAGEIYAIAYDSRSHRLVVALQDTGVGFQGKPRGRAYNALNGADGFNAAVNDHSFQNYSVLFHSIQNLDGFTRLQVDKDGRIDLATARVFVTGNGKPGVLNFDQADFTEKDPESEDKPPGPDNLGKPQLPFRSMLVLNKNDPKKIAIGTNFVYTTTDDLLLSGTVVSNPCPSETSCGEATLKPGATPLTKRVANSLNGVTAMSYGTRDNVDALLVGAPAEFSDEGGRLLLAKSANQDLTKLDAYSAAIDPQQPNKFRGTPISVVFDYNSADRFFAVDGVNLWHSQNGGSSFTGHLNDLQALKIVKPTAVEFIANNGVNALLVGGIVQDLSAQSPLAAANVDPNNGNLSGWTSFGTNLPNALIGQLSYNPTADVLAVGTFGRGAWLLYDVTAYFPTATVLRFGLADNDSRPEARFLTNGIHDSRDLEKLGGGTLSIDGRASYTGKTTVFGGTIEVNGSIASSSGLTVMPAGTLSGGGIVPATTMMGTIAPGGLAGVPTTLTVNTGYTQMTGSTYRALVNAAGQSDRIAVNGPASIQGGTVQALPQPGGLYAPRATYTILSATGGVSGSFSSASLGSSFLQPSITSDANNIYLALTINGFLAAAQTPLQTAVGGAIDSSVYSATGDYATVLGTLANLSPSQVPSVLTSLSGMNYSGFSNSMVQGAQLFMNNFLAQAGSANRGANKIALAEACDVACNATEPAKWGVWGGGLGGLGTVGADQPVGGVTYNLGGFAAGLDRRITNSTLAGVTVGYAGGTQWVSGFSGQGYSDTFFAGLYGGYAEGPVYLDGVVGYAYTNNRLSRSIIIPGLAARTANGQTGANQVYGQLEGGYRFDIGTAADAFITPFARLQAYTGTQNAFTENGAQSVSLNVAAQTTNSFRTVFGAQIGGAMDLGWREKLAVQLRLGWGHEYADTNRPVVASFVGAPSAPFTTYGISPQRDSAVVGFSANTGIADATSVYLRYEGNISGQDSSHALTAGFRMTW
jgi:outer membrane autotransporter protein